MRANKFLFGTSAAGLTFLMLVHQRRRLLAERECQLDWLPLTHDEKDDDRMPP